MSILNLSSRDARTLPISFTREKSVKDKAPNQLKSTVWIFLKYKGSNNEFLTLKLFVANDHKALMEHLEGLSEPAYSMKGLQHVQKVMSFVKGSNLLKI